MPLNIFTKCSILCIFIVMSSKLSLGAIVSGTLDTTDDWVFLARFCFLSENGQFSFNISYPEAYTDMKLLLYFDEEDQWEAVYQNKTKTCIEKASPPHILSQRNQDIVLKPGLQNYWSGCENKVDPKDGVAKIVCGASRTFRSSRARWWYIVASNCGDTKGIYMDYTITMTNSLDHTETFDHHFSADEAGILETNIAFLLLFLVAVVFSIITAVLLQKKKFLHSTYKLFMASLYIKVFAVFFITIAYAAYAKNGNPGRKYVLSCIGRMFGVLAHLIFVLMVILIGKGYTVTRGKLRLQSEIVITVSLTIYSLAYLLIYVVEFALFDPAEVLYLYDFHFGIGLVIVPVLGFMWLIYAVFFTLKHYPEKWKFYIPFVILFGLWFLTIPVVVIASNYVIPLHMREKVVYGVEIAISYMGYMAFLLLTLPCCVGIIFPYHVRTNKIGVMNDAPHESTGANGSPYVVTNKGGTTTSSRNQMEGASATVQVTRVTSETVTITNTSNGATAPLAPNLTALFVVQHTHSGPKPQHTPSEPNKQKKASAQYDNRSNSAMSPPPPYNE